MNILYRVIVDELNVRKGAGTKYPIVTTVKKGDVYTIIQKRGSWGKLKSGIGWINISSRYCEQVVNKPVESTSKYIHDFGNCVITNYYTNDELGSGANGCTGKPLTPNRSCASHNLPVGTKIYIEALKGVVNDDGIFIVEDTGGYCFDFDIFVSKDKSSKVGKKSLNVKVLEWGTGKMTASYTHIIEYYLKLQAQDGFNRIARYHDAWEMYKSMGGKLINFFKFNEEDKNIKNKEWYSKL